MKLDPFESIGFHCNLTFKSFFSVLTEKLKGTGISPVQFMALAHLTALGPLSQTELARRLSITGATTARLIDRMERDGWVKRERDPDDHRIKTVVLTRKSGLVWEEASAIGREILQQAYRNIDKKDLEIVKRVLADVRHNLGA